MIEHEIYDQTDPPAMRLLYETLGIITRALSRLKRELSIAATQR